MATGDNVQPVRVDTGLQLAQTDSNAEILCFRWAWVTSSLLRTTTVVVVVVRSICVPSVVRRAAYGSNNTNK